MREPERVASAAALDSISDHLGVVLQRADELLAEWSAFGAGVRSQVEREAAAIGDSVAAAVDGAVVRATVAGIDRAVTDHVGARLAALTAELARLEQQARAAGASLGHQRRGDRRGLWVVAAGVLIANVLLVALLVRNQPAPPPSAEPTRVEWIAPPTAPAVESPATGSPTPARTPPPPAPMQAPPIPADAITPGSGVAGAVTAPKPAGSHAGSEATAGAPMKSPPAKIPPRAAPRKQQ